MYLFFLWVSSASASDSGIFGDPDHMTAFTPPA
jgi:hypothetical protein